MLPWYYGQNCAVVPLELQFLLAVRSHFWVRPQADVTPAHGFGFQVGALRASGLRPQAVKLRSLLHVASDSFWVLASLQRVCWFMVLCNSTKFCGSSNKAIICSKKYFHVLLRPTGNSAV